MLTPGYEVGVNAEGGIDLSRWKGYVWERLRLSLRALVSRVETRMTSYKLHDILFTLMVLFIRLSDEAEMHLNGSSYIKFDMINNTQSGTKPATSETLFLQFKTFHPNGLLFYAHGTTEQYISLELAEGKLR